MSIKSLLQIILFLLILLIIGSIYYLYFYTGSFNNLNSNENLNKFSKEKSIPEDTEILESLTDLNNKNKNLITNSVNNEKDVNKNNTNDIIEINSKTENKDKINIPNENTNISEIKNLTKEIEYITSNKNGDIFKILAKYGKTNIDNSSVLDLQEVNGEILSDIRSNIYLSSDFANYNYNNQNSKFYDNVIIKYDGKIITCDKLDLIINENIAIAYSNVVVKDDSSIMKAQIITLDIITKDIKINSDDKINIIKKNN